MLLVFTNKLRMHSTIVKKKSRSVALSSPKQGDACGFKKTAKTTTTTMTGLKWGGNRRRRQKWQMPHCRQGCERVVVLTLLAPYFMCIQELFQGSCRLIFEFCEAGPAHMPRNNNFDNQKISFKPKTSDDVCVSTGCEPLHQK